MLEWIRPPQQARTRQTLGKLLDAAEALVLEKGFDDAGIAEIAARAGSSVGGFYRRFHDKQGLLHAMHERFCDEARATADAALDAQRWAGSTTVEILPEFVEFLVRIFREREGLIRAFLMRGVSNQEVRERTQRLFDYIAGKLGFLLAERVEEIRHPNPALGAAFGLHVILGALDHSALGTTTFPLTDDRLAPQLSEVFLAYLGVRADTNESTTGGHNA
jgi:AcrR family transcriptional regulator